MKSHFEHSFTIFIGRHTDGMTSLHVDVVGGVVRGDRHTGLGGFVKRIAAALIAARRCNRSVHVHTQATPDAKSEVIE